MRSRTLIPYLALVLLVLTSGAASAADFAQPSFEDMLMAPQADAETVGTPRDPGEVSLRMSALQSRLAGRQVRQALNRPLTVQLTEAERARIDVAGSNERRYLVGVAKPVGQNIDFTATRGLGLASRSLSLGAAQGTSDGGFIWTASVRVPGAAGLRLHLTNVDLPAGAGLYVYDAAGHAFGPYRDRGPLGTGVLHTNTVFGEQLFLQLESPPGQRLPSLRVENVGVLGARFTAPRYGPRGVFAESNLGAIFSDASNLCSRNADCVVNAGCASSGAVNTAKDAVAGILFQSGGSLYICTGGLVTDTVSASTIPYFLTAHHCISSSGEAASLETYFDYATTCNSPNCTQPYNNTGETVGSAIQDSSADGDHSLLRLSSTPVSPDGVVMYLGWLSTAVANTNNTALFRISHPAGSPQAYSEQVVDTGKPTCRTLPRGEFIYSRDTLGATEGGSSGSPVVNGEGQIVGQLYGACGTNLNDVCDAAHNATVDGAFAFYYNSVAPFLNPGSGGGCGAAGSSCSSNSQCCSNSCKGKPGAKTCKG